MKKLLLTAFLILNVSLLFAQQTISFKLYGFVRNDFNYNTRKNVESLDGLFNLFPSPKAADANGADMNAQPNAEMLSIASRIGLDITGNDIFGAKASAKIETDFGGNNPYFTLLRIRQAYARLNWTTSELTIGQTWHPMFGSVVPTLLNLNGGAPFQPFNRSPQLRFTQNLGTVKLIGAASYQLQYLSNGPNSASNTYLKNANLPSLFAGIENKTSTWLYGAGVDYKTIRPRTTSTVGTSTYYNVNESLSTVSGVAYAQYTKDLLSLKGKAIYGQNLSDMTMLGGYGVSAVDPTNGQQTYTSFQNATAWINASYGKTVQVGVFAGICKNLGTLAPLYLDSSSKMYVYGSYGLSGSQIIDALYRASASLTYNKANWMFGLEYAFTTACYGDINAADGNVVSSTIVPVTNHRVLGVVSYSF